MSINGFIERVREYSWKDYLFAPDAIASLLIVPVVYLAGLLNSNLRTLVEPAIIPGMGLCFALLAINVAVHAVVVTLSDAEFNAYLTQKGVLAKLLFVFEYTSIALFAGGIYGFLLLLLSSIPIPSFIPKSIAHSMYPLGIAGLAGLFVYSIWQFWHSLQQLSEIGSRRAVFTNRLKLFLEFERKHPNWQDNPSEFVAEYPKENPVEQQRVNA